MEYYADDEPMTTEQLTVVQINQLKEAWQRANQELTKYKDIAFNLQQKVENLTAVINESYNQLELESAKSQLSQLCCSTPNKPVLLVKELANILPKLNYHSLVATAFVKTGESWIALSSSTVTQETIHFKSRIFDEMLRFRSRSKTSKVTVESLPNILPLPVINYIHSGTVPATESAFDVFNDESKGHGSSLAKRAERGTTPAEILYHDAIILRLSGPQEGSGEESSGGGAQGGEGSTSERCVWVITVAPQYQSHSGVDIYSDEIPLRRLAVEQFGAHPLVLSGHNDYYTRDAPASEVAPTAVNFWFPLLDFAAQLVMTALLHQFESKRMETQVLQSEAVSTFSSLLSNAHAASADLVLEAAGLTSYAGSSSAQLLETQSQRSEEDDVLQSNTLLDDAYWDKIWQSVPSTLEEFLTQHIEGLSPARGGDDGAARVQRTCRSEVYIGSATLIAEVNKRASLSGTDAAHTNTSGGPIGAITEIPLLNSKRAVSVLRLQETANIDGHVDALDTVLRAALLKDLPAVQSYSEVSFQEKVTAGHISSSGGSRGGKFPPGGSGGNSRFAAAERGPHVEFHTVIAVPLLRTEQQDAVYQHMTVAEEHEMGAVKGCVLVHVTSVLVDNGTGADGARGFGGFVGRAHPTYTASFTTSSTNTHSAYMEHLAGSYSLLESGRQPLVMGVVDIVEVLGGMLLTFLYAHNCRPLSLLPMSSTISGMGGGGEAWRGAGADGEGGDGDDHHGHESAVALSLLMGSASTSYADASRWNNCITDGLFALLQPGTVAAGNAAIGSGVAPSLQSLAYTEESKSANSGFRPLSQDHLLQHNAQAANVYAALMYHLCTLFHSDWALVITSDLSDGATSPAARAGAAGDHRGAHWAPRLSVAEDEEVCALRVINNAGGVHQISSQELPAAYRSVVTQALSAGTHQHSNLRGHRGHHRHHHAAAEHDYLREIAGMKTLPVAELLPLLQVDPRLRQSIHSLCDSDAAVYLHHTVALCLDPHSPIAGRALEGSKRGHANDLETAVPPASNIVVITGRFLRGPFYTPFSSTPAVTQLNLLFQTALARRDLLYARETVTQLLAEKAQSLQEIAHTKTLEERLTKLHKTTLSGQNSNIASLVAFRKGLLSVLIEFFSDLHRLHFAPYLEGSEGHKGLALEVVGIELVVDESTGLEEGRHRKWALSATTADWVRVQDTEDSGGGRSASAFQRSTRRKVAVTAAPQQTLHSQLNVADFTPHQTNLTAEVVVDELSGVYEERGAAVLHIHRKHRRHDDDRSTAGGAAGGGSESGDESLGDAVEQQDLIGMLASIHVHYEHPVLTTTTRGSGGKHSTSKALAPHHAGTFFTSLQSSPVFMRILRNFIGANAQALFQPLYPIYTPLKMQHNPYQHISIDEEQQWEDDALYAQASNIAINALSTTIVHDSTQLLTNIANGDGTNEIAQQHPHYRYLHQRKLLRQLTVVPPFSAFMLIPIRELTTTEVSAFDDDTSSDSSASSAEVDVEDVRYIHLLPSISAHNGNIATHHGTPMPERRRSQNPVAQCMLPVRLNESIRDAVRSAREEQARAEDAVAAGDFNAASSTNKARRGAGAQQAVPGSHRIRTSRLTVLDGGMGSVLHNYLSDLHERQQRRRAHGSTHRGNHEYDLYGYVDIGNGAVASGAERSGRSHSQEIALVDPHSLVLLYTPLLHCNKARANTAGLDALEDESGVEGDGGLLFGDTNAALDHYYLVVCRQDRMIVPSSLVRLQTCLDELFLPSRVLAASQPWFECMSGIEQLVRAATVGTTAEFKRDTVEGEQFTQESALTRSFPAEPHSPHRQHHSHHEHPHLHVDAPLEMPLTYSAAVMSVESQCQRILMETITIMKRIVGDRCLGAVGYQLRVHQADLPDLLATTTADAHDPPTLSYAVTSETYRTGNEIELVRCCSDVGLVSSPTGKVMTMLQGPSKLQCPATASHILQRFSPSDPRNHRNAGLGHSPLRSGHHHRHHQHPQGHADEPNIAIHYVEMSSLEHIKQLQHSATSGSVVNTSATPRAEHSSGTTSPTRARRTTNVAAVQEVLNAAHVFLRADVRVLQLLITSCPSQNPQSPEQLEPHVVASVLLYLSQAPSSTAATATTTGNDAAEAQPDSSDLPSVAYIHRQDILQQVETITQSSLHRGRHHTHHVRAPHVSSLTRGILSCLMRVGDTAGALLSSLYRQQYDSYLQAHTTRNHRTQMQVHAQRLANTLLQINHELTSLTQEGHHDAVAGSPHGKAAKKHAAKAFHFEDTDIHQHGHHHDGQSDDPQSVMAAFLSDANHQKEAAEHALDAAHNVTQQFHALRQHFVQEQQSSTEIRSKYSAAVEEGRRKAAQFRAFFAAVQAALSIAPPPNTDEDDVNSLNSGLDKVAYHNAAVPELSALQSVVAAAACNTQTLRKALEMVAELAVHEDFAAFLNALLAQLSACATEDTDGQTEILSGSGGGGDAQQEGDYERILRLIEATPYAHDKKAILDGPDLDAHAPDVSATVWWLLEPGSHVNAINLASAVQTTSGTVDVTALHSKEKFLEALNTKQAVVVDGDELLRMLPQLLAYFSANGHVAASGHLPSVQLMYQPILATLPSEEEVIDDISYSSAEESHTYTNPGDTVVVAVVQYVMAVASGEGAVAMGSVAGGGVGDDASSLGGGSAAGGGGNHHAHHGDSSLAGVMRQVGRERVEAALTYLGQHATLHSKIAGPEAVPTAAQVGRGARYTQHTLTVAMNQFVPRLLQENNLVGGIHYQVLLSALRYVMDPVNFAPPAAPAPTPSSAKKDEHASKPRRPKGSSGSVSGKRSGGSVRNQSISSRSSTHSHAHSAEKIAAVAVYTPISVWIGKLLAVMLRADAASMLHITGSVRPQPKSRSGSSGASSGGSASSAGGSDSEGTAGGERHSPVVYEGVLYKYSHGVVTGGAANDERQSLQILRIRPSSWTPLQSLLDKYQAFYRSNTPDAVFVTYQESVLSYIRKGSGGVVYSSRSVATQSNVSTTGAEKGSGAMCYILACSINTSAVASPQQSAATASTALAKRNVHFVDSEAEAAAQVALKENDDFIVVELTRRPSSADVKAFAAVAQLVQAYIWGQSQRNSIKQKESELASISGALATTSQRLVEEQQENRLQHQYSDLMGELQRQMNRSLSERSAASVSSVGSAGDLPPPGGEFTPRLTDILQCVHRTQDLLCETLGDADSIVMLSAPRMICAEMSLLLRNDTLSVASRGSSGVDDELLGNKIDTVTRNISKRALARIMAVEYHPGPNGQVNVSEFQEAAAQQYELARYKFAALAVQLNQVLVCDVADIIAEEAMSLNINISKTAVPALARSIIIPIIDHAPEPVVLASPHCSGSGVQGDGLYEGEEDVLREDQDDELPTSRLQWLDPTLRQSISAVLSSTDGRIKSPDVHPQGAYYMQYYYDQRPRVAKPNAALTSTCKNSAHAWAMQVVFPTLEARDAYVTVLLGGNPGSKGDNMGRYDAFENSPFSSPVKGATASRDGPSSTASTARQGSQLPITFVAGISHFLKNNFVLCRNYVKEDVALLQARVEADFSSRVTTCMEQILQLASPPTAQVEEGGDAEQEVLTTEEALEVTPDTIAAAVAHVFQQLKGKLSTSTGGASADRASQEEASDEDEETPAPPPTAATFECNLQSAQMHWCRLPAHNSGPATSLGAGSVRFEDHISTEQDRLNSGTWLTVALNETPDKKTSHSGEEKDSVSDARGRAPPFTPSAEGKGGSAMKGATAAPSSRGRAAPVVEVVEEVVAVPAGYKVHRDYALHKRCRDHAWRTVRSPLSAQQIQALKDSADGLLLIALPATTPHLPKPKRARSTSPGDKRHGQTAGGSYSSASKQRGGWMGSHSPHRDGSEEEGGVATYLNADGTVTLQLLVLVVGSEQPAVLEVRLKCNVTSGTCCPDQLARALNRRRSRKHTPAPADELALAEMLEQVACSVLQPALPTVRLVRSSVAHLLEHCVAARGLLAWEGEWEAFLQHAQQRISLLSTCMTLLTSEGYKAAGLLQVMQEALCRLPTLFASTLICRDTITNQVLYNRTMDYASNNTTDFTAAPPTVGSQASTLATPAAGLQTPGAASYTTAFPFPESAIAAAAASGGGKQGGNRPLSPSHRVAYLDISGRAHNLTLSTPLSQRTEGESLKDQFGNIELVNPDLDNMEQLELVFECYEIQGSLTVYFHPDDGTSSGGVGASSTAGADAPFSPIGNAGGAGRSDRAWSPSKRAPVSPYEPLRSPGAHRRAREQQRRTRIDVSELVVSTVSTPTAASAAGGGNSGGGDAGGQPQEGHRDLVSLNTLLETITRAMARRVFELHRGSKNKKMLASKQQELSKRTSQLAKQDERLETLQAMNNMSRQELQTAAAESERLRLLMYAEQRNLKEALKQKKEMNAHLRQSLLELRQESDTRNLVAKKQIQELRERIRGMEAAREKEQKEMDRVRKRETAAEASTNTLMQQVAEMQRMQKTAEGTVRQLRQDLAACQKELAAAQAREKVRTDGEDSKVQGFLQKISRLDEELVAARGTNAFLKKQLETMTLQLKMAGIEDRSSRTAAPNVKTSATTPAASTRGAGTTATTPTGRGAFASGGNEVAEGRTETALDPSSPLFDEMAESLSREQEHTAMLRKQLHELQMEGNKGEFGKRN